MALQGPAAHAEIDFSNAWDKVAAIIRRSYYARESRKSEMEKRLGTYGPIASKASSKGEFRDIVDRMIAEFKDSHFELLTDEDQGYYMFEGLSKREPASMPEIGAWFRHGADGYTVQMVLNGTAAEKAGLRKGDMIVSGDGKPFSPVECLRPDVGKKVSLVIRRNGSEMIKEIAVESKPALELFLDATRDSASVIEQNGKKIGYVHLWTQASDDFRNVLAGLVYGRFKDTDGMILDLRDGFGGRPEGYGDPFFRPDVQLEWKYTNSSTKQLFGYQRPLVVLINGGSRSAKEVLSYLFKKSHRAVLVGSNTAGNVLGTTPQRIADWAFIEIPIVEVFADGIRLEGRGVAPDMAEPMEFDDKGNDLYLTRALKVLSERLAKR